MKDRIFLKYSKLIFITLVFFGLLLVSNKHSLVEALEIPEDIAIAATIEPWLYFEIFPLVVDLEPDLIAADGSLNIGESVDVVLRVGTNNENGWYFQIRGANNGLRSSTLNYLISSVNTTSSLITGTDGYGANAEALLSGVLIGSIYEYYGTNTVGEIINDYRLLAIKNSRNLTSDVLRMKIKATASLMAPASYDYLDIITITLSPII